MTQCDNIKALSPPILLLSYTQNTHQDKLKMSGIKVPSEPTPRPALEDDPEGRLILDVILDTRAKQEEIKVKMEEAKLSLESLEKVKANGSPLNAEGQSNYETLLRLIRLIDTALVSYLRLCYCSC
jgi:FKBP-type peptidyl-prolyl cis-trans isomerase (trigger factor)